MLVVDSSAVLRALLPRDRDAELVRRLSEDGDLRAPHLIDVEVLHALRRLVRSKAVPVSQADAIRADYRDLTIVRYPHPPLADRIWQMRDNMTAYDAAFIALSEALEVPLITCDARLSKAPGSVARVELYR